MGCGASASTVAHTVQPIMIFPNERLVHAEMTTIRQESNINLVRSIHLRSKHSLLVPLKCMYLPIDMDTDNKDMRKIPSHIKFISSKSNSTCSTSPNSPALPEPRSVPKSADGIEGESHERKVYSITQDKNHEIKEGIIQISSRNQESYKSCRRNLSLNCFARAAENMLVTQRLE
jgi:hypothetical protein